MDTPIPEEAKKAHRHERSGGRGQDRLHGGTLCSARWDMKKDEILALEENYAPPRVPCGVQQLRQPLDP